MAFFSKSPSPLPAPRHARAKGLRLSSANDTGGKAFPLRICKFSCAECSEWLFCNLRKSFAAQLPENMRLTALQAASTQPNASARVVSFLIHKADLSRVEIIRGKSPPKPHEITESASPRQFVEA